MKKLMLGLSVVALTAAVSAPSFAREVKQVVGYVKTESIYSDRDAEFHKFDKNRDGVLDFAEFQDAALLDNEYEMFDMNDTNNDQVLTIDEYRSFSKWAPRRTADGPSMTHYNFNKKASTNY